MAHYQGEKNARGEKHGRGTLTFPCGSVYIGNFKNDKFDGFGIYKWSDGNKYEGFFKEGKQEGYGCYSWPSGGKYEGYWKDDKMEGKGKYIRCDGVMYEGEWRNDRQYGYGKKTIPERINYGAHGIMSNKVEYEEYWNEEGKLVFQRELLKKPNMFSLLNRNKYDDVMLEFQ